MVMEPVSESGRLPDAVPPSTVSVEAFSPLLRSLLSWDLVRREETSEGERQWVLIEDAQKRLDALAGRQQSSSGVLAYLDHWCAGCHQRHLTHLIEGRYLCEDCERIEPR